MTSSNLVRVLRYAMTMKSIALLLTICITAVAGQAESLLDLYVREAVQNNPSYAAALARVEAYDERIPQSSALPDPMINFSLSNIPVDSWKLNEEPMTQKGIMISQAFPFPGIRSLQRQSARDERNAQSAMLDDVRLALIQEVSETFYRWAGLRETISITRQTQAVMTQMADVAISAYKVGRGTQQNVLRAQNEILMLDDRLLELSQLETSLQKRMLTLMNRELSDSLAAPDVLPTANSESPLDSLQVTLEANSPRLREISYRLAASDKKQSIARKQSFPMFTLGAGYMQRESTPAGVSRSDFVTFQAGTTLPLYGRSKQNRLVQQRQIESRQIEHERANLLNQLRFETTDLHDQQRRLTKQQDIYESAIIPRSRQVFDAALADYQNGRGDFDALVSAQRDLLRNQQMLIDRSANLLIVDSQIDELIGAQPKEDN